jgi:hypothetical protein
VIIRAIRGCSAGLLSAKAKERVIDVFCISALLAAVVGPGPAGAGAAIARQSIAEAEAIVVAEVVGPMTLTIDERGVANYSGRIKVIEVLKGPVNAEDVLGAEAQIHWPPHGSLKTGDRKVFLLRATGLKKDRDWETFSLACGVQPESLAPKIRELL